MLPGATVTPIDVPTWLDVLTVVVAALGGALFASRRHVTVTGVLLVAVCVGLGGGMIRDVLLDVAAPKALSDPLYLPAAGVAAVCGMLLARWSNRIAVPMLLLDSLALGLFAVVGVERTLAAGFPPASAVLIGVIAGTAGGIIRDLLVGDAPAIMQEGPWDASAALAGSVLMVTLVAGFGLPTRIVEWPIILMIGTLAVLSVRLAWRAPMAASLSPVLERPAARVRRVTRPDKPQTPHAT
ncbi:MAG: TRIC cation channel family protein [Candidatus Nanopelagicales bacterium]